ncbi:MAG: glycosyltransferase [Planctomycetota bacterium]
MRRIAILIDALNPRAQRSEHPPQLVDALTAAGMQVELHWVSGGMLARLDRRSSLSTGLAPLEGAWSQVLASRPDAVLAYDPASPAAWLAARICRRLEVPLLLIEPAWFTLRPLHERALDSIGRRLWGRRVRQLTSQVICLDPIGEQRVLEAGYPRERIERIPTGVDPTVFRPGATSHLPARHRLRGRMLLYAGPLASGRGLEQLMTAYGRTVGQRSDWSLVLAGSGPLRNRLDILASRLGCRVGVRFLPWPERDELPGLMCASTIMAVPGEDDRARGRQIVRAMACGLPVMVSPLPRLSFRIEHERTGYVVPDEPRAWEAALDRVASAPAIRREWASEARATVERDFAWPVLAQRYVESIERAIDGMLLPASA